MAGGLSRRSPAGAAVGGILGVVLGMALGACVSWVALPRFIAARQDYIEYDLIISLAMHVSICGLVGAAAGLAFAVGLGDPRLCGRILAAGLLGAAMARSPSEMIGAAAFPVAETDEPISKTWLTRLLARMLVSLATAVERGPVPARAGPDRRCSTNPPTRRRSPEPRSRANQPARGLAITDPASDGRGCSGR